MPITVANIEPKSVPENSDNVWHGSKKPTKNRDKVQHGSKNCAKNML